MDVNGCPQTAADKNEYPKTHMDVHGYPIPMTPTGVHKKSSARPQNSVDQQSHVWTCTEFTYNGICEYARNPRHPLIDTNPWN